MSQHINESTYKRVQINESNETVNILFRSEGKTVKSNNKFNKDVQKYTKIKDERAIRTSHVKGSKKGGKRGVPPKTILNIRSEHGGRANKCA